MNPLDYESPNNVPINSQSISASVLLQKAQTATPFAVECSIDLLFEPEESSQVGLPSNHVLEICAAPGEESSRFALTYTVSVALDPHAREVLFIGTYCMKKSRAV